MSPTLTTLIVAGVLTLARPVGAAPAPMPGADAATKRAAIRYLEDARAGADVLMGLSADPDPDVRGFATLALGRLEAPRTQAALEARLDDPIADVRRMAAFALGQLGPLTQERALLRRLDGEGEAAVRVELWRALARVGADDTLAKVRRAAAPDRVAAVMAAARILRRSKRPPWNEPAVLSAVKSKRSALRAAGLNAVSAGDVAKAPLRLRRIAAKALETEELALVSAGARVLYRSALGVEQRLARILRDARLTGHQRAGLARGLAATPGKHATATLLGLLRREARAALRSGSLTGEAFHALLGAARGLVGRPLDAAQRRLAAGIGAKLSARFPASAADEPAARRATALACAVAAATGDATACTPT